MLQKCQIIMLRLHKKHSGVFSEGILCENDDSICQISVPGRVFVANLSPVGNLI